MLKVGRKVSVVAVNHNEEKIYNIISINNIANIEMNPPTLKGRVSYYIKISEECPQFLPNINDKSILGVM